MTEKDKLFEKVQEIAKENDFFLIEFVWRGSEQNRVVEIYIDNRIGISTDFCRTISRQVEKIIDDEKLIPSKYRLDVSSPGIERPLIYLEQYEKNIGRIFEISLNESEKAIQGKLIKILGKEMYFEVDNNEILIDFEKIKKANVIISF
jgi:ribosome maturation factor RimP